VVRPGLLAVVVIAVQVVAAVAVVAGADVVRVDRVPVVRGLVRRVAAIGKEVQDGQTKAARLRGLSASVGLWVLCLLTASAWMMPEEGGSSLQRAVLCGVAGFVALLFAWRRHGVAFWVWMKVVLVGVLMVGVPTILFGMSVHGVSSLGRAVVTTLAPVMVCLAVSQRGRSASEEELAWRLVGPALAGVAGVLLLFPFDMPASLRGWVMLGVVVLAVGMIAVAGVWLQRVSEGLGLAAVWAAVLLGNALVLGVLGLVQGERAMVPGASAWLGLAEIALLVWLVWAMPPLRLMARFLAVPLVAVLEGFILMRPSLTVRLGAGIGLLVLAVGWILWARTEEGAAGFSLR